eukprot:IDg2970t1
MPALELGFSLAGNFAESRLIVQVRCADKPELRHSFASRRTFACTELGDVVLNSQYRLIEATHEYILWVIIKLGFVLASLSYNYHFFALPNCDIALKEVKRAGKKRKRRFALGSKKSERYSQAATPMTRTDRDEVAATSLSGGAGVGAAPVPVGNDSCGAEVRVDVKALMAGDRSIDRKGLCAEFGSFYWYTQAIAQYAMFGAVDVDAMLFIGVPDARFVLKTHAIPRTIAASSRTILLSCVLSKTPPMRRWR